MLQSQINQKTGCVMVVTADLNPVIDTVAMESVKAWQCAECFIRLKL